MSDTTQEVIWEPQPGPQTLAIRCPIFELFFGGARGGGKTDFILGDWSGHAGTYGAHAHGIIFRRTMPELDDVIARSRELFVPLGATFREQAKEWVFPNGATLRMRYLDRDADADSYQGHAYCVAVGTPILMADNTWKPIESIHVGEMVQTLEGPRRVTDRVKPYKAQCVKATVRDASGACVGVQVHPVWHPVLASEGWRAYSRDDQNDCKESVDDNATTVPPQVSSFPVKLHAPTIQLAQRNRDSAHAGPIQGGSLRKSARQSLGTFPGMIPLPWDRQLPAAPWQSIPGSAVPVSTSVGAYGQHDLCAPQDWRGDYPSGGGSDDGCARLVQGTSRAHIRPQGDAAVPCQTALLDETDTIPSHSHQGRRTYPHPYTGVERHRSEDWMDGTVEMAPCGESFVADLTVDGANHYISACGLINKNTWIAFDEAGNWPSPAPIDKLRACLRSAHGVPCLMRLTGNPGGVGHNWLKARYVDGQTPGRPFMDPVTGMYRVFIPSRLTDNRILTSADPTYINRLRGAGAEWLVKAWEMGDWSGPPVGGIINPNWLRTYTEEPNLGQIDLAADLAYRVKQTADRSAIGAFGMTASSELTWKPDIRIGRFDTLESVEHILSLAKLYNAERLFVGKDMITGSIGPFLYKLMEERKIWLTVIEVAQHQDQLLRSRSFIARTQQGKVLWPEGDLFRKVIHPELVGYHGRGEQPDDIVAMAAHACMGLDSSDEYTEPAKPKWKNPDEKRWKEHAERKKRENPNKIESLFGD